MDDDDVKVCVAIAVANPELNGGLQPLPGAVTAARSIIEWAGALSYRTLLITDEGTPPRPVTIDRLRTEITPLIDNAGEKRGRIIIAFAGHGVIDGTRDYWLLSEWFSGAEQVVDVQRMRDVLATYQPAQITVISDACRQTLPNIAPMLSGSRVFKRSPWEPPTEPDCDLLLATGIGKSAFMVKAKGDDKAYCLFTQVVCNALWGRYDGSVDESRPTGPVVTSQTLKLAVRRELPREANLLNEDQSANITTNFTPPDDVYTLLGTVQAPPRPELDVPPPEGGPLAELDLSKSIFVSEILRTNAIRIVEHLSAETNLFPTHFETHTGIAIAGAQVKQVVTADGVYLRLDDDPEAPPESKGRWWVLKGRPSSVLVELDGRGDWIGAALMPQMIAAVSVAEDGVRSVVYSPGDGGDNERTVSITQHAIAALHAGTLSGSAAYDFAGGIRQQKHINPVLGVIAAYLYAREGDYESIRKMAWFYRQNHQPIPFDIALLGRLSLWRDKDGLHARVPKTRAINPRTPFEAELDFVTQATDETEAFVGGSFPWLRQGWSLLQDSDQSVCAPLLPLAGSLRPALFTTLPATTGRELAQLIRSGAI